jgi:hypothetical protein
MRDPAAAHQFVENKRGAISKKMCAIEQHYGGATFPCSAHTLGTLGNRFARKVGQMRRGLFWRDENIFDARQTLPLLQREDFQFLQIDWLVVVHGKMRAMRFSASW